MRNTTPATVAQIRDYLDQQVKAGRGDLELSLDRRGLFYLQPKHLDNVGLSLPHGNATHDDDRVFLMAVF